ncbi:MAG: hypothetical protein R6U44_07515 [Archaeoglobaceae archaeon]
MGRTMSSVRMEVKKIAERWVSVKKALKKEDQQAAQELAAMAKKHSSETFYLFDDPLEAAVFSVLLEMQKKIDEKKGEKKDVDDTGLLHWQEEGSAVDQG